MKAILLAAGRGKRMRPLSDSTPKPLLKVGGVRLIEYHIQALAKMGLEEIVVNVAHLSEQFPEILGDGSRYGLNIHYSFEPEGGLETGGGIINAMSLLGAEPFLVINSDIFTDYPFTNLKSQPSRLAHVVLVDNPTHNPKGDFSINKGNLDVRQLNTYTYSGVGVFHPDFFSGDHPEIFSLTKLLNKAITDGTITAEYYDGTWLDIGTPERLKELDQQLQPHKEALK